MEHGGFQALSARAPFLGLWERAAASNYRIPMLLPRVRMCYNRRAVDSIAKAYGAEDPREALTQLQGAVPVVNAKPTLLQSLAPGDDISRYCPVCSQRLTARHCKLFCTVCGYYMSCADFY